MLEIRDLGKTYGYGDKATQAMRSVSFTVDEGEFVCVVGPSGCGKTTLLKCIAGLMRPTSGEVVLDGQSRHVAARGDGGRLPGVQPLADALDDRAQQRPPAAAPQEAREGRADDGSSRSRSPRSA